MIKSKKPLSSPGQVIIFNDADAPFVITEAFRKIATNVGFAIPKKENGGAKVFCITSALAGEGKTTMSINVALSLTKSGSKVALVDCDLRNPSVRRNFHHFNAKKGLESYLSGQANLDSIIYHDETGLDVIATLQSPPNPMALLNSDTFDKLLSMLSERYEMVVIDTPPLTLVSDAAIIGPKTDGVVIVTRQMFSNHRALKSIVGQLRFAKCNILGFVLNSFALARGGYYGKHGQYGKYGKYGEKSEESGAKDGAAK